MRKLFLFVLIALFTIPAFSQEYLVVSKKLSNLLEATAQTTYVQLPNWLTIDSVGLSLAGYGEIDIDSVDVYPGFSGGNSAFYGTTAYTFLCDPNVAASTKFWTNGCGVAADKDAATVLTSSVMRGGINTLKCTVQPADGSAAGNYLYLIFRVWGTPK